jgi:RND family efflux transporter MFP subunit
VAVETIEAQRTRTPHIVEVVGTIRARVSATVAARVAGTVTEIAVQAGDFVAAGQLLAQLDDRELRAEFERAQADWKRFRALLDRDAVTRAEFDTVESRYRVAAAQLSHARIVAPFDGLVTGKEVNVGDLATPGQPLFRMEQPTAYRLEVAVPERDAAAVAVGKTLYCVVEASGEKCEGVVDEVEPAADPLTRTVLAKIALRCRQPVRSGLFGRAQLVVGERFALFVPRDAVHARGQLTYVYVVEDGRARQRLVRTGKEYLGAIELLAGVEAGERVIVAGRVTDGQAVRP